MEATLANPSLHRGQRGRGKTAFERNLLPGFASWLLEQIEQREPDYLVPAETKGVRLLEAVLRYARQELLVPVRVPVICGSALAYMDPEALGRSRVMIVDDAVKTGANLERHRARVESYGATVAQAVACVGDADVAHPGADCYLSVEDDLYREYVWQLTELVVARGLPPEVDHFLFELRLPERLQRSWWKLEEALGAYGTVTIDASRERRDEFHPMTLHFPALPGIAPGGEEEGGAAGPRKLRFFPDPQNDCVYVVPVAFPALTLPPPDDLHRPRYSADPVRERIRAAVGRAGSVGELLAGEARALDAETAFEALSAGMEVELACGLATVLAADFPGAELVAQREPFERLYGPDLAAAVVAHVAADLDAAAAREASFERVEGGAPQLFLDSRVADATESMEAELRAMYEEWLAHPEHDPAVRTGRSLPEIVAALPDRDPLLASRCVDFGLATTTIVPFVAVEPRADGSLLAQRKYRVSELGRDEQPHNVNAFRLGLSEEAAAAICHCVADRSQRFAGEPIPLEMLTSLVAILQPLVFEDQSIVLEVRPSPGAPEPVLLHSERPVPLGEHTSRFYSVKGGAVKPTRRFRRGWDDDALSLDLRKSAAEIDAHVGLLAPFLDELEPARLDAMLKAWAMCTDGRFGLTHVRSSIEAAVEALSRPLNLILREEPHERSHGVAIRAEEHLAAARAKLQLLDGDWSAPLRERWQKPAERRPGKKPPKPERRVLASLRAPAERAIYELPRQLVELISALAAFVESLDGASVLAWRGEQASGQAASEAAVAASARACRALTSLVDGGEVPLPPRQTKKAIAAAAEELLSVFEQVRTFVAAAAGPADRELVRLRPPRDVDRHASVLSVDLAGSRSHTRKNEPRADRAWRNSGLGMATLWIAAFLGREGREPAGDDLWIEFPVGDPAVLCGAAIQLHARAFGVDRKGEPHWRFHAAVDAGELLVGHNERNTVAGCLNRVTKLAKKCDADAETDDVFVAPAAWELCSAALRDDAAGRELSEDVELGDGDEDRERLRPVAVDARGAIHLLAERIGAVSAALRREAPALAEAPLDLRADGARVDDAAEASGSAEAGGA